MGPAPKKGARVCVASSCCPMSPREPAPRPNDTTQMPFVPEGRGKEQKRKEHLGGILFRHGALIQPRPGREDGCPGKVGSSGRNIWQQLCGSLGTGRAAGLGAGWLRREGKQSQPSGCQGTGASGPGVGWGPPGKEGQVRAGAAPRLGSQAGGGEAQSQPKGNLEGLQKV